jgi:hypothetical protein
MMITYLHASFHYSRSNCSLVSAIKRFYYYITFQSHTLISISLYSASEVRRVTVLVTDYREMESQSGMDFNGTMRIPLL